MEIEGIDTRYQIPDKLKLKNRNCILPHIEMFMQNSRNIYSGLDIGESVPSAKF